jgi:predicted transcriptional regulator
MGRGAGLTEICIVLNLPMENDHGVFEITNEEAEAAADARGFADADAKRVVSHEAVKEWLASWGTEKRLPRPRVGE